MVDDVISWPATETKSTPALRKPSFSNETGLPPSKSRLKYRPEDDILVHSTTQGESRTSGELVLRLAASTLSQAPNPRTSLNDLPLEIQEGILDYTHGTLGSAISDGSSASQATRNWSLVMRHPRRKQLSDLALVSRSWRNLVQQRLYRHIRTKGTKEELEECGTWFLTHPYLRLYVKHLDIWVPLWEVKDGRAGKRTTVEVVFNGGGQSPRPTEAGWFTNAAGRHFVESTNISYAYQPATHNATLDEIFSCASLLFPQVCALTIEGGHCKKPPKIPYFRETRSLHEEDSTTDDDFLNSSMRNLSPPSHRAMLAILPHVSTLILKGAWNVIRCDSDFQILSEALPNLREWHCSFSKPKPDGYTAICGILRQIPRTIVRLNLCLEGLYAKEDMSPTKWRKVFPVHHVCLDLGPLCPHLERLTYTGRVCSKLFQTACTTAIDICRDRPPLKSIDLVVKNCCREPPTNWTDSTGVHTLGFIQHFRSLIIEACRALEIYKELSNLRIRYIDLESPLQLMNPSFHLRTNGICTGFWDDGILAALRKARPEVQFEGIEDPINDETVVEGDRYKKMPKSMHIQRYLDMVP